MTLSGTQMRIAIQFKAFLLAGCLVLPIQAIAQVETETRAGDYLIYHTVFNSSFISPEIAEIYQLTRGSDKAIANVAVTEADAGGMSRGLPAQITGVARNLMQQEISLEFIEVKEQDAVYYIAPFEFDDQEIMHFYIDVVLPGESRARKIEITKKLYHD